MGGGGKGATVGDGLLDCARGRVGDWFRASEAGGGGGGNGCIVPKPTASKSAAPKFPEGGAEAKGGMGASELCGGGAFIERGGERGAVVLMAGGGGRGNRDVLGGGGSLLSLMVLGECRPAGAGRGALGRLEARRVTAKIQSRTTLLITKRQKLTSSYEETWFHRRTLGYIATRFAYLVSNN